MTKILTSVFAIVAVAAVAGVGSYALWSDTEGSNGNYIAAGSLDLTLNGIPISIPSVQPGQTGSTILGVKNEGTVPGGLTFALQNVKNLENGCIEPELNNATPADTDCGAGDDQGELGDNVQVSIHVSYDDGLNYSPVPGFSGITLNDLADTDLSTAVLPMPAGADYKIKLDWTVDNDGPALDNVFMTDSFEADFVATLTQVTP